MNARRAAVRLALAAAVVYLSVPTLHLAGDTDPQLFTASAWILQGNAKLDPYVTGLTGEVLVAGSSYSTYTPGLALVASPFIAPFLLAGASVLDLTFRALFGRVLAALLAAASVALVYLACRRVTRPRPALAATVGYGFATGTWAVASQELWQHSASQLLVALGVVLALSGRAAAPRAGAAFGVAALVRPFDVIGVVFGASTVWRRGGRLALLRYSSWGLPAVAFLLAYDLLLSGSPAGFLPVDAVPWAFPPPGLAGLLVSPSRGLFIFSPYLLLAVIGGYQAWRNGRGRRANTIRDASLAVVGFWLVFASVSWWWGGWTYGNRYLLDALPLLSLLVAYAIGHGALAGRARTALFGVALAWSVLLQLAGAVYGYRAWNGYNWNATPPIDLHTERLWDWTDPQWWSVLRQIGTDPFVLLVPTALGLAVAVIILRPVLVTPRRAARAHPRIA